MAEKQPRTGKDPLHLEFEDRGITVDTPIDLAPLERNHLVYLNGLRHHAVPSSKERATTTNPPQVRTDR